MLFRNSSTRGHDIALACFSHCLHILPLRKTRVFSHVAFHAARNPVWRFMRRNSKHIDYWILCKGLDRKMGLSVPSEHVTNGLWC